MENKTRKIEAVDVYFERRKTREYVGRLSREGQNFVFNYDSSYAYGDRSIPLGPDLPLSPQKIISKNLFTTFEDRIPSKKNPAYQEYCRSVGIEPTEKDPLVLVATIGQKGPSSFIFSPAKVDAIIREDVMKFRNELKLSVREFSELFDFSPATIHRIETKKTSGKDALKRIEVYYLFPEVALYEVKKNGFKVNDEKRKFVEDFFKSRIAKTNESKRDLKIK